MIGPHLWQPSWTKDHTFPQPTASVEQSAGLTDIGKVADNSSPAVVGTAEAGKMTKQQYKKLQVSDPTAAHEALIKGNVEMREDNYVANQTFDK